MDHSELIKLLGPAAVPVIICSVMLKYFMDQMKQQEILKQNQSRDFIETLKGVIANNTASMQEAAKTSMQQSVALDRLVRIIEKQIEGHTREHR